MKQTIKQFLFGKSARLRSIKLGLLRGLRFHVDPRNKSQRLLGIEEFEITGSVKKWTKRANTAVDIGANDGWYSVYFAAQRNIKSVFACEPDPSCLLSLDANLSANGDLVRRKAIIVPSFIGTSKCSNWCSVDELLKDASPPFLIKVDVDGLELDVLKSARHTLEHKTSLLIVETHSLALEQSCIEYLRSMDYECRILPNGWYRLVLPEQRPIPHNRWFSAERVEST